jgi:probable addiction module antidote protein
MALKTLPFDAAAFIDTPEDAAEFLADAFESGDPGVINAAIGAVARAKGMSELAKEAGLSRPSLYRSLSEDGHPEFATVMKILGALGMTLKVAPASAPKPVLDPPAPIA